jgi:hypothetical protein
MDDRPTRERVVVVHHARTWTEAMVIRSLFESAGIASPATTSSDPFPLRRVPKGTHGIEIQVLESHAEDARAILADYLASAAPLPLEDDGEGNR